MRRRVGTIRRRAGREPRAAADTGVRSDGEAGQRAGFTDASRAHVTEATQDQDTFGDQLVERGTTRVPVDVPEA